MEVFRGMEGIQQVVRNREGTGLLQVEDILGSQVVDKVDKHQLDLLESRVEGRGDNLLLEGTVLSSSQFMPIRIGQTHADCRCTFLKSSFSFSDCLGMSLHNCNAVQDCRAMRRRWSKV